MTSLIRVTSKAAHALTSKATIKPSEICFLPAAALSSQSAVQYEYGNGHGGATRTFLDPLLQQQEPFYKQHQSSAFHTQCRNAHHYHDVPFQAPAPHNKAYRGLILKKNFCFRPDGGRFYSSQSGNDGLTWTDLDYNTVMSYVKKGDIQLFDVRTTGEVEETGMMPTATNVPLSEIQEALRLSPEEFRDRYGVDMPLKDDTNIVFSCLGGIRSRRAMDAAHEAGFNKARHYLGGWEDYEYQTQG